MTPPPIYNPYAIRIRLRQPSPMALLALYLWMMLCLFSPLVVFLMVIR